MSRLIDADALVHELTEMVRYNTGEYKYGIVAARIVVMDAPTIDGWISVKDRLPETNDEVLTTYLYDNEPGKRYVESASYFDDGEGEGHWYSIWDEHTIGPVRKTRIAWMPMPKPYKPPKED